MATALDLSDLVELVEAQVNYPGSDFYPDATEDDWVLRLRNAFWQAVLAGLIVGYSESDGVVQPTTGDTPLPQELQQIIICFVEFQALRSKLLELKTAFRVQAGPTKYEVEQSAQVLKALLDDNVRRTNIWLERLSDLGYANSYVIDGVIARNNGVLYGDTWWVG